MDQQEARQQAVVRRPATVVKILNFKLKPQNSQHRHIWLQVLSHGSRSHDPEVFIEALNPRLCLNIAPETHGWTLRIGSQRKFFAMSWITGQDSWLSNRFD
jgi:hypothetical protein